VREGLFVGPSHQPRFKSRLDIRTAQPKCLHEVVVHRVLVDVEAGLH
jgi:hypothetical protein